MKILLSLFSLTLCISAGEFQRIHWKDLFKKTQYEDPFLSLTDDQKSDLGMLLRLRRLIEQDKITSDESLQEEKQLTEKLTKQKVQIDFLLSQVEIIRAKRIAASKETNPDLKDKFIEMQGFVLPLKFQNKMVVEFLLVPWVGACIHTPPPPPNQIIYVKSKPFAISKPFDHFKIRGQLKIIKSSQELFLVDGKGNIDTSYQIPQAQVSRLTEDFQ